MNCQLILFFIKKLNEKYIIVSKEVEYIITLLKLKMNETELFQMIRQLELHQHLEKKWFYDGQDHVHDQFSFSTQNDNE